ncbi:MAG TPA: substrate-binding domain-containing protein [Terriglobia bacterium]|nr:substrate-binding domain-containing protein [Terriglobia bacterium]
MSENPESESKRPPRYYIEVLGKALDVMNVMKQQAGELRLSEIADAAHLDKATAFRVLYTLEKRGYVFRSLQTKKFKLLLGYRIYRVGYAQLSSEDPFVHSVTQGLIEEAKRWRVELIVMDNRADPATAVKNAQAMIEQKVDFAIEYQPHYRVAPLLAEMFAQARIPTMAIDIPQPGAIFFGANNYTAGLMGGQALGHFARKRWHGRVDRIILLELTQAGRTPQSRILGTLRGIQSALPAADHRGVIHRDTKGTEAGGYQVTLKALRSARPREHVLIAAVNDAAALGALRAIHELGRDRATAIIGHGFGPDPRLRVEIRRRDSALIGSVAYFPDQYGSKILPIILRWLNQEQIPPTNHTDHALVSKENIRQFRPGREDGKQR